MCSCLEILESDINRLIMLIPIAAGILIIWSTSDHILLHWNWLFLIVQT